MIELQAKSSLTNTVTQVHPHAPATLIVPGRHYDYEITITPRRRPKARQEPYHDNFGHGQRLAVVRR